MIQVMNKLIHNRMSIIIVKIILNKEPYYQPSNYGYSQPPVNVQ